MLYHNAEKFLNVIGQKVLNVSKETFFFFGRKKNFVTGFVTGSVFHFLHLQVVQCTVQCL